MSDLLCWKAAEIEFEYPVSVLLLGHYLHLSVHTGTLCKAMTSVSLQKITETPIFLVLEPTPVSDQKRKPNSSTPAQN